MYASPIGELTVLAGPAGVRSLCFPRRAPILDATTRREMPAVSAQLEEYFTGERRSFEVDLDLAGTPLQRAVWARLLEIPYGSTTTYGELADSIDHSLFPDRLIPYQRVRFAAAAIGRTPTPILVPCHRVIGADGSLTGYGGGLQRKRFLLDLEAASARSDSAHTSPNRLSAHQGVFEVGWSQDAGK
ncbi:MAG TPA: methylated-DNA--[protein]-cysteine S-methyltransferase [Solirubrobacterales bacterium]|nr:methylated-DNA--[protein]-cysteine S-methyltransferase [Solirubrobacterales bacterium]